MQIVFLDQNKWIDLARVAAGTSPDASHRAIYERIRSAAIAGKFIAPLTITQIVETAKKNDPAKRKLLAAVQAQISKGYVYRSRRAQLELEIANAIISASDGATNPAATKWRRWRLMATAPWTDRPS